MREKLGAVKRERSAEGRLAEVEAELTANVSDAAVIRRLYEERGRLTGQLASDLERWAELAEFE